MTSLNKYFNEDIEKEFHQNNVCATFESLKDAINKNYVHDFTFSMQTYINKIALILSKFDKTTTLNPPNQKNNYFQDCASYLCIEIIENKSLFNKIYKINKPANIYKHTIENVSFDIENFLNDYNKMISKLIKKTGLECLEMCHLYKNNNENKSEPITPPKRSKYTPNKPKQEQSIDDTNTSIPQSQKRNKFCKSCGVVIKGDDKFYICPNCKTVFCSKCCANVQNEKCTHCNNIKQKDTCEKDSFNYDNNNKFYITVIFIEIIFLFLYFEFFKKIFNIDGFFANFKVILCSPIVSILLSFFLWITDIFNHDK